ncbi:MAG: helicase, partial [Methylocystis sp.]|nr:helicase [Methylocystis sp.]
AETPAPQAGSADAEAEKSLAEPVTIEIWTLQRHAHGAPRRHLGKPANPRDGALSGEGWQRRNRRPHDSGGAETGKAASARPAKPRGERPSRPDRPVSGERRVGPAAFASSEKRNRERQPDPDSPFAKLAALKAELEKKGKG